jgi:uncharacterized RDD family membrane protein YckC
MGCRSTSVAGGIGAGRESIQISFSTVVNRQWSVFSEACMKYIVRTKDGKEHGPLSKDVILQWVHNGKVTPDTEIRNSLMKSWTTAGQMPSIQEYVKKRRTQTGMDPNLFLSDEPEEEEVEGPREAVFSLNQVSAKQFLPAGFIQRPLAWLMDSILTVGVVLVLLVTLGYMDARLPEGMFDQLSAFVIVGGAFWFFIYFAVCFGLRAQTFGQWFWGIMINKEDGGPVFAGRGFAYLVLQMVLFPTSPIFYFIMPKRRTLPELLTGTRIIRIKRNK